MFEYIFSKLYNIIQSNIKRKHIKTTKEFIVFKKENMYIL